jgi:hypothetical protein
MMQQQFPLPSVDNLPPCCLHQPPPICSTSITCRSLSQLEEQCTTTAASATATLGTPGNGSGSSSSSSSAGGPRKLQQARTAVTKRFESVVAAVETYQRQQEKIEALLKRQGIPWEGGTVLTKVKQASLQLARTFAEAALQEAALMQQQQQQQGEAAGGAGIKPGRGRGFGRAQVDVDKAVRELLGGAVVFVFRVHQFAGGLDEPTRLVFNQLQPKAAAAWALA